MLKDESSEQGQPEREDKITKLINALLENFGADACDVVERQIKASIGHDALTVWNQIWERLCAAAGRHVESGSKAPFGHP